MYCGGTVITQQAIQLASGVNVANLMELAKAAAIANNPKEAYEYYTKVLEYDPRNPTAWTGKGEAAGWMSTVRDLRTTEMIAGFNNAIKFAPDSDKQAMRKRCAEVINTVTNACYSIARKHVHEFVRVDNTWQNYLTQCTLLMSALEVGHAYDPNNKTTIENIIRICADNIQGISFTHFNGEAGAVFLSGEYEASLRAKIDKYTIKRKQFDPGYSAPQVERASLPWFEKDLCFVATATLGDVNHPAVAELRHFRDAWLTKRRAGRLFVGCYYRVGPYAARIIRASWVLQRVSYFLIVRPALQVARSLLKDAIIAHRRPPRCPACPRTPRPNCPTAPAR
jgi:hypothetical protein